eukprot:5138082-Prymnesium_polylepis.3
MSTVCASALHADLASSHLSIPTRVSPYPVPQVLVTGGESKIVEVWSLLGVEMDQTNMPGRRHKPEVQFSCATAVHSVALNPKGTALAVGTSEVTEVYEVARFQGYVRYKGGAGLHLLPQMCPRRLSVSLSGQRPSITKASQPEQSPAMAPGSIVTTGRGTASVQKHENQPAHAPGSLITKSRSR